MADDTEIRARLKRVITERLCFEGLAPEDIVDEDPLFGGGLGLDSVDALELAVGVEQEFGVKIESASIGREAFASVAALAAFVRSRLEEADAARRA